MNARNERSESHRNLVHDLSIKATTRAFNKHGFTILAL
ncbi:hypothetical protein PA257_2602 [Pseudomonas aeruginosa]|nr:hypothetical protein PA257_2602 [Pseudomonas aeruginosa]